jgi:predicted MFS family arabinose efflux permease
MVLASVPFLTATFFWYEARLSRGGGMPLVDSALLRIASFRRGLLVAVLFFFTTSFYLLFGLYQQEGRGIAPLDVGLAIVPYGVGLFAGPLITAPLVRLRPKLLSIGMGIQVTFYAMVGILVAAGIDGFWLMAAVFLAGLGQGIAFPRLFATVLGDVPSAQAGVAAGITNSAMQIGAAVSVAAIGSLFFMVLGGGTGERAYAHAFGIAQWAATGGLFLAMLISIHAYLRHQHLNEY